MTIAKILQSLDHDCLSGGARKRELPGSHSKTGIKTISLLKCRFGNTETR